MIEIWTKQIQPVVHGSSYTTAIVFLNKWNHSSREVEVYLSDLKMYHEHGYEVQVRSEYQR